MLIHACLFSESHQQWVQKWTIWVFIFIVFREMKLVGKIIINIMKCPVSVREPWWMGSLSPCWKGDGSEIGTGSMRHWRTGPRCLEQKKKEAACVASQTVSSALVSNSVIDVMASCHISSAGFELIHSSTVCSLLTPSPPKPQIHIQTAPIAEAIFTLPVG